MTSGDNSESNPIRGAGDVIAKITDSLNIPKCGSCKKRQQMLNNLFPFTIGMNGTTHSSHFEIAIKRLQQMGFNIPTGRT